MKRERNGETIEFEAFGALLPPGRRLQFLSMRNGMTVREIVESQGIDPEEIGLVTIDGRQSELDSMVPAGGRLCVFPPMSGG